MANLLQSQRLYPPGGSDGSFHWERGSKEPDSGARGWVNIPDSGKSGGQGAVGHFLDGWRG